MTYQEMEAKLLDWLDELEHHNEMIRKHQEEVRLCEYHIRSLRKSMDEALEALYP